MTGVEDVVHRLFPLAEAGNAVVLPDGVEGVAATGNQLVRIALMAGVEDDLVAGRVEEVVQGQSQLDDAEVPAEMAAHAGDDVDDRLANLLCDLRKLPPIEPAEIVRRVDVIEKSRHFGPFRAALRSVAP